MNAFSLWFDSKAETSECQLAYINQAKLPIKATSVVTYHVKTSVRIWIEDFIVKLQRHTTEMEQSMEEMEAEIRPDFNK
jgi:hypothetical protein